MALACRGFRKQSLRMDPSTALPTGHPPPPNAPDLIQTSYLEKFKPTMAKTETAANWSVPRSFPFLSLSTARCFPFHQTELADQAVVSVGLALCRFPKHIGHVITRAWHISPDQQRNCLLDI